MKKGVLGTFRKFTGQYLCQSFFLIKLISKTDIARIVKILLVKTLKLQVALPEGNFPYEFFSGNFQRKCSFE